MTGTPSDPAALVTATVRLSGADWELETKVSVPAGPLPLRLALPLVQALADRVVDGAVRAAEELGEHVSCKKGCGACCRQLVPIAEVEARRIREVVEELPEPRRSIVKARFADARRRLEAAGLLQRLRQRAQWPEGEARHFGVAYFTQGIACPFLEDESCSIYADRPVACREYLVTSPAEHCARPSPATIRMVPMPLKVWTALARFDPVPAGGTYIRWVPLILAPEWADEHPDEPPPRAGPEVLRDLFAHLTRRGDVPAPVPAGPPAPTAEGSPCPKTP
jgi:Fe-S-cluster containining protein